MNNIEDMLTTFKEFARQALAEQTAQLAEYKQSYLLSGKLDTIKVFNAHLGIFQELLDSRIKTMLDTATAEKIPVAALQPALDEVRAEFINEFLCISFIK